MSILFENTEHERKYYSVLKSMKNNDCYHKSVAYLFTLDLVCFDHINSLFDFKEDIIKRNGLNESWQTETSKKTTQLTFNLWNGCCTDGETYIDSEGYEQDLTSQYYAVDEIFCCSYAPYYWEAIKLRYPEYINQNY